MKDDMLKEGSEINKHLGGPVGVWAEGSRVMIKAVTADNQAVALTPAEAVNLGEMLKVFAAQIEAVDKK